MGKIYSKNEIQKFAQNWVTAVELHNSLITGKKYYTRLLQNIKTHDYIEEYLLIFHSQEEYKDYLKHSEWRHALQLNQPSLSYFPSIRGLYDTTTYQFCNQNHSLSVYFDKIELRLSDVNDLPFGEVLFMLKGMLEGFRFLTQHFGFFQVNEDLVMFTGEGEVNIWLNPNISSYAPIKSIKRDEKFSTKYGHEKYTEDDMLVNIISMAQVNVEKQSYKKYPKISAYIKNKYTSIKSKQKIEQSSYFWMGTRYSQTGYTFPFVIESLKDYMCDHGVRVYRKMNSIYNIIRTNKFQERNSDSSHQIGLGKISEAVRKNQAREQQFDMPYTSQENQHKSTTKIVHDKSLLAIQDNSNDNEISKSLHVFEMNPDDMDLMLNNDNLSAATIMLTNRPKQPIKKDLNRISNLQKTETLQYLSPYDEKVRKQTNLSTNSNQIKPNSNADTNQIDAMTSLSICKGISQHEIHVNRIADRLAINGHIKTHQKLFNSGCDGRNLIHDNINQPMHHPNSRRNNSIDLNVWRSTFNNHHQQNKNTNSCHFVYRNSGQKQYEDKSKRLQINMERKNGVAFVMSSRNHSGLNTPRGHPQYDETNNLIRAPLSYLIQERGDKYDTQKVNKPASGFVSRISPSYNSNQQNILFQQIPGTNKIVLNSQEEQKNHAIVVNINGTRISTGQNKQIVNRQSPTPKITLKIMKKDDISPQIETLRKQKASISQKQPLKRFIPFSFTSGRSSNPYPTAAVTSPKIKSDKFSKYYSETQTYQIDQEIAKDLANIQLIST